MTNTVSVLGDISPETASRVLHDLVDWHRTNGCGCNDGLKAILGLLVRVASQGGYGHDPAVVRFKTILSGYGFDWSQDKAVTAKEASKALYDLDDWYETAELEPNADTRDVILALMAFAHPEGNPPPYSSTLAAVLT